MVGIFRLNDTDAQCDGLVYARERATQYAEAAHTALDGLAEGPELSALSEAVAYAVDRRR